jgi:hypothetical protein
MVVTFNPGFELFRRIDRGIHFASEQSLGRLDSGNDVTESDLADNQKIHVAPALLFPPGHRTVNHGQEKPFF